MSEAPDSRPETPSSVCGIECPKCGCPETHVVRSTPRRLKTRTIRLRRRECDHCCGRFTTREEILRID